MTLVCRVRERKKKKLDGAVWGELIKVTGKACRRTIKADRARFVALHVAHQMIAQSLPMMRRVEFNLPASPLPCSTSLMLWATTRPDHEQIVNEFCSIRSGNSEQ